MSFYAVREPLTRPQNCISESPLAETKSRWTEMQKRFRGCQRETIYEVIKHCFRKACCRPSGPKRTRNTGINTDRTEAQETEQTGQTSQPGQCIWISATRGMKFHTRHNCYHIAGRAKDSYEKCSDCGRAEREAEYGRQGPTMLRGRP